MFLKPIKRKTDPCLDLVNKTKSYISCKKCTTILNIHHQSEVEHNQSQRQNISEYFSIPPSQLSNVKIAQNNHDQKWGLFCQSCQQEVGKIGESGVMLRKGKVAEAIIKYQKVSQQVNDIAQQKQTKFLDRGSKNLKQATRFQEKIKKYIASSFQVLDQKLTKINTDQTQKLQKQLQTFIKFYRKWTSKQQRNTNHPKSSQHC